MKINKDMIGTQWVHKNGNIYEIVDCKVHAFKSLKGYDDNRLCVWYKDRYDEVYVRTEKHFLRNFTMLEK